MWIEAPASDPAMWSGSIPRLLAGTLRGVVVHDLLPTRATARLVSRLQRDKTLPRVPMGGQLVGESLGLSLDRAVGPRKDAYFDSADAIHRQLAGLTTGRTLDALLAAALSVMARPMSLSLAQQDGQPRAPVVFRRLPRGGRIPPHAELEQLDRTPYNRFKSQLDPTTLLSFVLCLQPATAGGHLRVHDLAWSDYDRRANRGGHTQPAEQLRGVSATDPATRAGSLVVFDGGRWFHEVTAVEGEQERWSVGGFVARRADGSGLLYWS